MSITMSGFIFLPLIGGIAVFAKPWLAALVVFLGPLASMSVLNIPSISFGLQPPAAAAIALICVTAADLLRHGRPLAAISGLEHLRPLGILALWAAISGQLMPRLLPGTPVLNADGDLVDLVSSRLHVTQFAYLLLGVLIAAAALLSSRTATSQQRFLGALVASGWLAFFLGLIQIREGESPTAVSEFLFNNPGFDVQTAQRIGGRVRMASTLIEPSVAAVFFGGYLGAMLMLIVVGGSGRIRPWIAAVSAVMAAISMLLTTATTGVVALVATVIVFVWRLGRTRRRTHWFAVGLIATSCMIVVLTTAVRTGFFESDNEILTTLSEVTTEKSESSSADDRLAGETLAWEGFFASAGIGLGWGSVRAASLTTTLTSNLGLPGVGLVVWFFLRLQRLSKSARESGTLTPIASTAGAFAVVAFATSAFSSPDITFTFLWMPIGGAVAGCLPLMVRRSTGPYRPRRPAALQDPLDDSNDDVIHRVTDSPNAP